MRVFAVSDLHLSGFTPKPMNIFGDHWTGHWDKIRDDWNTKVHSEDIVLIPGDISWAMKLSEAKIDLDEICAMPGQKILLKGNHDYWWSSLSQVESLLSSDTFIIQNNSISIGDYVFAGTRGWHFPGYKTYNKETDEKLYLREAGRLELSLSHAKKNSPDKQLICMMHFPPSDAEGTKSLFTDMFEKYEVSKVVYGHLHSVNSINLLQGDLRGVEYTLVACDYTGFKLVEIA